MDEEKILTPLEMTIKAFLDHNSNSEEEYVAMWDTLQGRIDTEVEKKRKE